MAISQPTAERRLPTWARLMLVIGLLYTFLAGVKFLESGIKAFGSDTAADLFEGISNPLAGLFAGILATVLVQSSSVTTATIVGLVGSGTLPFDTAVPMIMGANIGTTVTNTLASLGHIRRSEEFKRAFAGATMHDFFNLMAVSVLLPLELITGFLSSIAEKMAEWLSDAGMQGGELGDSPLKSAVKWPVDQVKDLLDGASDNVLGAVLLVVGLGLIFLSLAFITKNMKEVLAGRIERSMNEILSRGGGVPAMLVGLVMTVAVQSSSITTSILIPIIAAGVLTLTERLSDHARRQRRHHGDRVAGITGDGSTGGAGDRAHTYAVQPLGDPPLLSATPAPLSADQGSRETGRGGGGESRPGRELRGGDLRHPAAGWNSVVAMREVHHGS